MDEKLVRIDNFYAWGIDTRSGEGHGFIGRYWWFNNKYSPIPPQLEGCHLALFKTRKIARENLPSVKRTFPKATVKQVIIKVLGGLNGAV